MPPSNDKQYIETGLVCLNFENNGSKSEDKYCSCIIVAQGSND